MTSNLAPAAGRAVPGGALFALAIGLLLYLTTSLVLGSSVSSRVFEVSLSLPSLAVAPETHPSFSGDPISGSRLTTGAPSGRLVRVLPIAVSVVLTQQSIPATIAAVPSTTAALRSAAMPGKARAIASKRSHYHDADERSHRLARRR